MTIEQIEESLPNGLHDANIRECMMDYEHSRVMLEVNVLVGLPDEPYPECERYRPGVLVLDGVLYYSVEFPLPGSSFRYPGPVGFSCERTPAGQVPADLWKALPAQCQCYSLFVRDWLSTIYIAATDVSFSWSNSEDQLSRAER